MSSWLADRGQTLDRESVTGQAAWQPDLPSWECNAGMAKIKAQEGKGEPDVHLCVLDTVDGHLVWSIWLPSLPSRVRFCSPFWLPSVFEICRCGSSCTSATVGYPCSQARCGNFAIVTASSWSAHR